jgi:hypothetical protein
VARRYGARQIKSRQDDVIADLEAAFAEAITLTYTAS